MQGLFKLSLQSSHDPSIWLHVLLQLWGHCEEQFFPWVPTSQAFNQQTYTIYQTLAM